MNEAAQALEALAGSSLEEGDLEAAATAWAEALAFRELSVGAEAAASKSASEDARRSASEQRRRGGHTTVGAGEKHNTYCGCVLRSKARDADSEGEERKESEEEKEQEEEQQEPEEEQQEEEQEEEEEPVAAASRPPAKSLLSLSSQPMGLRPAWVPYSAHSSVFGSTSDQSDASSHFDHTAAEHGCFVRCAKEAKPSPGSGSAQGSGGYGSGAAGVKHTLAAQKVPEHFYFYGWPELLRWPRLERMSCRTERAFDQGSDPKVDAGLDQDYFALIEARPCKVKWCRSEKDGPQADNDAWDDCCVPFAFTDVYTTLDFDLHTREVATCPKEHLLLLGRGSPDVTIALPTICPREAQGIGSETNPPHQHHNEGAALQLHFTLSTSSPWQQEAPVVPHPRQALQGNQCLLLVQVAPAGAKARGTCSGAKAGLFRLFLGLSRALVFCGVALELELERASVVRRKLGCLASSSLSAAASFALLPSPLSGAVGAPPERRQDEASSARRSERDGPQRKPWWLDTDKLNQEMRRAKAAAEKEFGSAAAETPPKHARDKEAGLLEFAVRPAKRNPSPDANNTKEKEPKEAPRDERQLRCKTRADWLKSAPAVVRIAQAKAAAAPFWPNAPEFIPGACRLRCTVQAPAVFLHSSTEDEAVGQHMRHQIASAPTRCDSLFLQLFLHSRVPQDSAHGAWGDRVHAQRWRLRCFGMPRYRLYKTVVAGATGRVGEALTRQLLLSPLCAEVHSVGRREARAFDRLSAAESKLRHHLGDFSAPECGVDPSSLEGVDSAFCVLGSRRGWSDPAEVAAVERDAVLKFAQLCAAARVPHFSVLSSAWAHPKSRMQFARTQGETAEALAAMESFRRISLFAPAAATGVAGELLSSENSSSLVARVLWQGLPLAAQFMPNRYRPVALDDIALAMRLNVELCDASERVERLQYRDMMMIIGRDSEL
ncbi:unnamed protein product [Polarella glacialis]|uniref:NAD(P)-binding domain-containing protein n=1 Tax=Polarella glacialis TaxID=89957 RepID=A0A813H9R4_POLGL|nr:unnamed protein product [Polarella glacialis]